MTNSPMCDQAGISVLACQAGGICDCFRERVSEEAAEAFRAGERFGLLAAQVTIAAEIQNLTGPKSTWPDGWVEPAMRDGYDEAVADAAAIAEGDDRG